MCDFKGKTQFTLNKQMNTKHHVNECNNKGTEKAIECILCEEKFNSGNGFQKHISEHMCDMCSFESGNENIIRDHLIEHVKIPKVKEDGKSEIKKKKTNNMFCCDD